MERWFEFMGHHPFLFGTMFVLIVLFLCLRTNAAAKINPNAVGLMVNNQNAQLIDIRPRKDFEKGYIKGSRNIPFTELKITLTHFAVLTIPLSSFAKWV